MTRTVTIPASVAKELIEFMESVASQWGGDYLFTKYGHDEDVITLTTALRKALNAL